MAAFSSDAISAEAVWLPRMYQIRTSASKIIESPFSQVSDPGDRVFHILAILPHSKGGKRGEVNFLFRLRSNRHELRLLLAAIEDRYLFAPIDRAEDILHTI